MADPVRSFSTYLTVAEAAGLLGVSVRTLHNWDRQGKLRARRHPLNRYRLYERSELEELLQRLTRTGRAA